MDAIQKVISDVVALFIKSDSKVGSDSKASQDNEKKFLEALEATNEEEGLAVIQSLIEKKAVDLKKLHFPDGPPLVIAARRQSLRIGSFLLAQGCSPLEKDSMNRTPFFHLQPRQYRDQDRLQSFCKEMEKATSLPPSELWKMRDKDQKNPFHCVAKFLTKEWIPFLKERDADFNALDRHRQTPLYSSLFYQDMVKLLIENGAQLDCVDTYGRTPLSEAFNQAATYSSASQYYYNSARALIEAGAIPDETCLNEIYQWGSGERVPRDLALILLEKGCFTQTSVSKLALAVELELPAQVKKLLEEGEDPNWSNPNFSSLLQNVAMNGNILSFFYLLEHGIFLPETFDGGNSLRHGLVEIYRKEWSSASERHEAIRNYLSNSKEKFSEEFSWKRDYEALSKELEGAS